MNKKWKLIIGIEPYYLTDEEKDFYINAVNSGVKYVALNDKTLLGTQFQSLVHLDVIEESKKMDNGKWQCKYGTWHNEGWDCNCGVDFVFDDKSGKYIKQPKGSEITKV